MDVPLEPDTPAVIAILIMLAVLVGSAVLWIRQVQRPSNLVPPGKGVAPWAIGWVNFGIFLCTITIAVLVAHSIGFMLFVESENPEETVEITPWLAVLGVLLLQGPMIAAFYLLRRFYPGEFAGNLSRANLSFVESFKQAASLFIMLLPVIWLSSLIWTEILSRLEAANLIKGFEPQTLVTLFQDGDDWLAISCLAVMAVVVAPLVEEVIFRGCIYRFLKSQMTILPAQISSGIIFSLIHGNVLAFVPLAIVGIILAHVYEKSGSLAVAIWFHALFNAFTLLMLLIAGMSDSIPTSEL